MSSNEISPYSGAIHNPGLGARMRLDWQACFHYCSYFFQGGWAWNEPAKAKEVACDLPHDVLTKIFGYSTPAEQEKLFYTARSWRPCVTNAYLAHLQKATKERLFALKSPAHCLSLQQDGSLYYGTTDGQFGKCDASLGSVYEQKIGDSCITSIAPLKRNRVVASCGSQLHIIHDSEKGDCEFASIPKACLGISCVGVSEELVAAGAYDSSIHLFGTHGMARETLLGHAKAVKQVMWMGNTLVSSSFDGTARLWQGDKHLKETGRFTANDCPLLALARVDEALCAIGGKDKTVTLFDIRGKKPAAQRPTQSSVLSLSSSCHTLASSLEEGIVSVWDVRNMNTALFVYEEQGVGVVALKSGRICSASKSRQTPQIKMRSLD